MRVLPVVISLVCFVVPLDALAKPKPRIAVATLKGDPDGKIAEAIIDALAGKDFVVVTPAEVSREITKLDLSDELDARAVRKLTTSLDVVAIVGGAARTTGRKRSVHLDIHRRGKRDIGFTIEFKTTASAKFHRGVHDQVIKRLDGGESQPDADDDDGPAARRDDRDDDARRKQSDEDSARKRASDEDTDRKRKFSGDDAARQVRARASDDDRKRRSSDDEPAASRRKRVAGDDEPAVRKRKTRRGDGASPAQALARAGAGASVTQRQLTYDTRSGFTQVPPRVVTTSGGGRVDGELYPFALFDPNSRLARLGLAACYDKTFGLSIKIPNLTVRAPINQSHYAIGARYRLDLGQTSTITLGLDYIRRHYLADRARLMAVVLDAPDVDYTALAPGVAAHVPLTPTITAFAGLDGMLMLETGPIQRTPSYGPAKVYGIEALAGVDVAIAAQIGLRVALEYSRISLSFNGKGEMTTSRDNDVTTQDVNGATDRWIGVAATLGLVY